MLSDVFNLEECALPFTDAARAEGYGRFGRNPPEELLPPVPVDTQRRKLLPAVSVETRVRELLPPISAHQAAFGHGG